MRLDPAGLVDYEHRVAEMIENRRIAIHRDWDQPFPTGECLSFVGERGAVAQRAREAFVVPAFAGGFAPELKIDRGDPELPHWRHFNHAQLTGRELVLRIKLAQRIDRVAEKFQA